MVQSKKQFKYITGLLPFFAPHAPYSGLESIAFVSVVVVGRGECVGTAGGQWDDDAVVVDFVGHVVAVGRNVDVTLVVLDVVDAVVALPALPAGGCVGAA